MIDQESRFWAIVPAAGNGRRMQQSEPKQYTLLNGKPILEHSISALLLSNVLEKVLVCIAPGDQQWTKLDVASNDKVEHIIGGATRAQSVLNGLEALNQLARQDDWVLVHDAARPCVKTTTVLRLMAELANDDVGGILACRSNDTLKYATQEVPTSIMNTLDRNAIWRAQTPQMFRFGLLNAALSSALKNDLDITDEASAMESAGHNVRLIEGDSDNLKVTTKGDLALAEFLLRQ